MDDARRIILELRGHPAGCDFCGEKVPVDQLEPEEAGMWVCHACIDLWAKNEKKNPHAP